MTPLQEQWNRCLAILGEKINSADIIDTWLAPLEPESFDQERHVLILRVPSSYVCKALEHFFVRHLSEVLSQVFGKSVRLQYRLPPQEPQFADVAAYLQQHSAYDTRRDPYNIRIPDAAKRLRDGLHYFLKGREQWLPAYDKVADWLQDNKGRGLLCIGTPGLGKSLLCQRVLPVILGNGGRPIASVNAADLHDRLPELMKERIVIIDDLGKEDELYYGNIDRSFFELCNNAERTGQLLIITTNLSTTIVSQQYRHLYPLSIEERYGREVLDRLSVIIRTVLFYGESMRPREERKTC